MAVWKKGYPEEGEHLYIYYPDDVQEVLDYLGKSNIKACWTMPFHTHSKRTFEMYEEELAERPSGMDITLCRDLEDLSGSFISSLLVTPKKLILYSFDGILGFAECQGRDVSVIEEEAKYYGKTVKIAYLK